MANFTFPSQATNTLGYEKLTVSNAVKQCTESKYYNRDTHRSARAVVITVDGTAGTNDIRWTTDGTAPQASTTGHLLQAKDTLTIYGLNNIANLKMIRESSDAVVHFTYLEG